MHNPNTGSVTHVLRAPKSELAGVSALSFRRFGGERGRRGGIHSPDWQHPSPPHRAAGLDHTPIPPCRAVATSVKAERPKVEIGSFL